MAAAEPTPIASAPLPASGFDASPWLGLATTLVSLLIVLALAWLMLRWLRRSAIGSAGSDGLRVQRAISLGARERLVVVVHGDTEYLLGVTAASVTLIDRRPSDRSAVGSSGGPA